MGVGVGRQAGGKGDHCPRPPAGHQIKWDQLWIPSVALGCLPPGRQAGEKVEGSTQPLVEGPAILVVAPHFVPGIDEDPWGVSMLLLRLALQKRKESRDVGWI